VIEEKGQAIEAYIAMSSVSDTKVLMTSYLKTTLLKVKIGYLILIVHFIYVPIKRCSTP